jgi:hypothetical protein
MAVPVLTYRAMTWTLIKSCKRKLEAAECGFRIFSGSISAGPERGVNTSRKTSKFSD